MLEHILRRMGFGASPADLAFWSDVDPSAVIDRLLNYESLPTDIDTNIGDAGLRRHHTAARAASRRTPPSTTRASGGCSAWCIRRVRSKRRWRCSGTTTSPPAYSKIAGAIGQERATRTMDNDPASLAGSPPGQIQLFRQHATGNFRDLLLAVSKDPAMIYWLDRQLNTRTRPQENFGREIMELFSMGIGNYTEHDVYAAARVFTGFNWQLVGDRADEQQLLRPSSTARTITTSTPRSSPSRSIRTAAR